MNNIVVQKNCCLDEKKTNLNKDIMYDNSADYKVYA